MPHNNEQRAPPAPIPFLIITPAGHYMPAHPFRIFWILSFFPTDDHDSLWMEAAASHLTRIFLYFHRLLSSGWQERCSSKPSLKSAHQRITLARCCTLSLLETDESDQETKEQ